MAPTAAPPRRDSELLSLALKAIRRRRDMTAAQVAGAMVMPLRTFEHFEAGAGRVNLEHLHRFAKATDSDPHALIACLALGSPDFALRCADNKLMTILMVVLQEVNRNTGDTLSALDARTLIGAFTRAFDELGDLATRQEQDARAWLEAGIERLTPPSPADTE